jgi:cytochrome c551
MVLAGALLAAACSNGEPSPDLTRPRDPAAVAAGTVLFDANCAQCHGTDLTGGRGPSLIVKVGLDDAVIRQIILRGQGPIMPAFRDLLTDDEIGSIIDYVRTVQVTEREG